MPSFTLPRQLSRALRLNAGLVQAQTNGLAHADSLLQPPDGGDCLNWQMGHLVRHRVIMLASAGLTAPLQAEPYTRYARDSQPVPADEDVLPLPTLLADFATAQEPLLAWLEQATDAELDHTAPGESRSVLERLALLIWHETLHVGQLEQARRLAGHGEKVV